MPAQHPFPDEDRVSAELAEIARGGWSHDSRVFAQALILILRKENIVSKATDDLNAAIAALSTSVQGAVTDIQTLTQQIATANANGDTDGVEAAVAQINTLAATLNSAVAPVQAAAGAAAAAAPPADNSTT